MRGRRVSAPRRPGSRAMPLILAFLFFFFFFFFFFFALRCALVSSNRPCGRGAQFGPL
jgi:hypothetical protein